ncbi:unnamed protein product [Ilex paraguariensis]|uniref:Uncharacterized protein n=1 Tax=Ilex paraguariensis TaxID=185542 RepID=A0ABC8RQM1_9AQUA
MAECQLELIPTKELKVTRIEKHEVRIVKELISPKKLVKHDYGSSVSKKLPVLIQGPIPSKDEDLISRDQQKPIEEGSLLSNTYLATTKMYSIWPWFDIHNLASILPQGYECSSWYSSGKSSIFFSFKLLSILPSFFALYLAFHLLQTIVHAIALLGRVQRSMKVVEERMVGLAYSKKKPKE